jgi:hypothetical protein
MLDKVLVAPLHAVVGFRPLVVHLPIATTPIRRSEMA